MHIQRGNIYYIHKGDSYGSEMIAGRPGIIVSNDANNATSQVVEVVFLTTQEKPPLPTHVRIITTGRESTALCEQVTTVDVSRLGDFAGCCSTEELKQVDKAVAISLGLVYNSENETVDSRPEVSVDMLTNLLESKDASIKVARAEAERDVYKKLYTDLLNQQLSK